MKFVLITLTFLLTTTSLTAQTPEIEKLYDQLDQIYAQTVRGGFIDYTKLKEDGEINGIAKALSELDASTLAGADLKAFMLNAYNLNVLQQIVVHPTVSSVKQINGFYKNPITIAGQTVSLDEYEGALLSQFPDARLHMALVCGASGCPPLLDRTFRSATLEADLNEVTSLALTKQHILNVANGTTYLSKIFQWYSTDFGNIQDFVAQYSSISITDNIVYNSYDWSLNDVSRLNQSTTVGGAETLRYFASNLYEKGQFEINIFNNYYSQKEPKNGIESRDNFFNVLFQGLYGINNRLNVGLDVRLRSVSSGPSSTNRLFDALRFENEASDGSEVRSFARYGITQVAPRVKYQPFKNISNLTFQHSLYIPVLFDSEGGDGSGYIDWGSPSLYTDLFYDQELTQKTSLFLQVGAYFENIGGAALGFADGYWQFATPITTILNYFPTEKSTIYFLVNAAPQFGFSVSGEGTQTEVIPNHYNQYGLGYKYFITDRIQAEVLYTGFFSAIPNRTAATYNFGVRYYGW